MRTGGADLRDAPGAFCTGRLTAARDGEDGDDISLGEALDFGAEGDYLAASFVALEVQTPR